MNGWLIALVCVVGVVFLVGGYALMMNHSKNVTAREQARALGFGEVRQDYAREQFDKAQLDADWDAMNADYAERAARKAAKRARKDGA